MVWILIAAKDVAHEEDLRMLSFEQFNQKLLNHVLSLTNGRKHLFVADTDYDTLWNLYLNSFPEGTNEIFRERREMDCSSCRHFIRDLGNVVVIVNGSVKTVWDFKAGDDKYQPVLDALSGYVKSCAIRDVLVPESRRFGTEKNVEIMSDGTSHTWYHLFAVVDESVTTYSSGQVGTVQGRMRDVRNVLQRSLDEISDGSIETVLDLIAQNSLYKGEEWKNVLTEFRSLKNSYSKLKSASKRKLFCWEKSVEVGPVIGKIKNHSIGVLLADISEGIGLDAAVTRYEKIVAPTNYKRPKAIFTKKMVDAAQKKVEELGYKESLGRRFATMEDITVRNTLFANRDAVKVMSEDPFDELAASVPEKARNFSKVDEISAEDFVENILPNATDFEVLLENKHMGNMVSLLAPKHMDAKTMFKWGNGFSWVYSGNIADSMKERVKAMGGKVDGDLRFSIQWNDNNDSNDDLDAHCKEPGGYEIYFRNKGRLSPFGGMLDVDIINPLRDAPNGPAVENITWGNRRTMRDGKYTMFVHNYTARGARGGFSAEVEYDGQLYSFSYDKPLRQDAKIHVADVVLSKGVFSIEEKIPSHASSRDMWGLESNRFHKVSIAMFSPNYWDKQSGIGHKHYFFMLDGCVNPETPNGFFNEYLDERLLEHKRVFEALGSKMRVENSDRQLSGVGFSSTKRAEIVVKIRGSFDRMLKVKF